MKLRSKKDLLISNTDKTYVSQRLITQENKGRD